MGQYMHYGTTIKIPNYKFRSVWCDVFQPSHNIIYNICHSPEIRSRMNIDDGDKQFLSLLLRSVSLQVTTDKRPATAHTEALRNASLRAIHQYNIYFHIYISLLLLLPHREGKKKKKKLLKAIRQYYIKTITCLCNKRIIINNTLCYVQGHINFVMYIKCYLILYFSLSLFLFLCVLA